METLTEGTEAEILKNDKSTWSNFKELWPKHSMLLQHFGIGHAEFIWEIRQNPKVYEIFAELWEVKSKELLVSFDGASIHLPPEKTGKGWFKKGWYHCDQSFKRNDFECVQSFISGEDINEGDATLRVLEKSHLYHKKFSKHFDITSEKNSGGDWYKLSDTNDDQLNYYLEKGCKEVCIKCSAGSMVFWDSRTIHYGQEPLQDRENINTRYVVYLCYTPRDFGTETNIKKKQKAFNEMRTTSHWPHKQKLFPVKPRTYGKELIEFNDLPSIELSKIGKKFCGF